MSRINGDKARTASEKRRRTLQREKDRARRAAAVAKTKEPPAASR